MGRGTMAERVAVLETEMRENRQALQAFTTAVAAFTGAVNALSSVLDRRQSRGMDWRFWLLLGLAAGGGGGVATALKSVLTP